MKVIPAIDLLDGKVVRLQKGDYNKVTVYNDYPIDEARKFKEAGFRHIHIVDLNGARDGTFKNLETVIQIMDQLGISVQAGGGIRSYRDGIQLLEHGLSQIICSSLAVKKPKEWLTLIEQKPGRAILGMDLKEGKVAYGGWLQTSDQTIREFLDPMIERGLKTVLSTDISRDGMLSGANEQLYRDLQKQFPQLNFIASGGVAGIDDLQRLQNLGLYGVVVGRAYYEGHLTLDEMARFHRD